ncbi:MULTISPECIES: hypothetical protein [unclassified Lysinibacillus]|nr:MULTISPECIES: hypothetical protein [unclassified Lysinibacillus]
MNILKWIDEFLFGTAEEQNEFEQREKLWYYLPIFFAIIVLISVYVFII